MLANTLSVEDEVVEGVEEVHQEMPSQQEMTKGLCWRRGSNKLNYKMRLTRSSVLLECQKVR